LFLKIVIVFSITHLVNLINKLKQALFGDIHIKYEKFRRDWSTNG